jgi:hypothetical protein
MSSSNNSSEIKPNESLETGTFRPMQKEIILFRSVSPKELIDILDKSQVTGGLNRFNTFDHRREVFFGDAITEMLLGQGEEISRRAENMMQSHKIQEKYRAAQDEFRTLTSEAKEKYVHFYKYPTAVKKKIDTADKSIKKITSSFRAILMLEIKKEREINELRTFTSAVIETKPVGGGRHYSTKHNGGSSGMGDDDEYGFESGVVKITDIAKIHLMLKKELIKTIFPDETGKFTLAKDDIYKTDKPKKLKISP